MKTNSIEEHKTAKDHTRLRLIICLNNIVEESVALISKGPLTRFINAMSFQMLHNYILTIEYH